MSGLTAIERLLLPLVRRFVALWVRPSVLPDGLAERLGSGRLEAPDMQHEQPDRQEPSENEPEHGRHAK